DSDHVAPRDALPALRQFLVEEPIELERLPERVNEPDVAESPRAFYADSPASDGDDRTGVVLRLLEQIELVRSRPEEMARQLRSALPLSRVEGAEVRDDLLTDLGSVPDGANKPPVRVLLAVLADEGSAQVHRFLARRLSGTARNGSRRRVGHYIGSRNVDRRESPDGIDPRSTRTAKTPEIHVSCSSWVNQGLVGPAKPGERLTDLVNCRVGLRASGSYAGDAGGIWGTPRDSD